MNNGSRLILSIAISLGMSTSSHSSSPGTTVGTTYWDSQHEASTGRQIDEFQGTIQVSFMCQELPRYNPGRLIIWNKIVVAGSPAPITLDNGIEINALPLGEPATPTGQPFAQRQAGYVTLRNRPDGKAVVTYHSIIDHHSWVAQCDQTLAGGSFILSAAPQTPDHVLTKEFIYPKCAVDVVGTDTIVHAVTTDPGTLSDYRCFAYRGIVSGAAITWNYFFVDTISTRSPIVEASPVSDDVAIVYTKPRTDGTEMDNDLVYRYSTDGGISWGSVVNVTSYSDSSPERAYNDVSALFDDQNTLHIVFNTLSNDPDSGLVWSPASLWHWNSQRGTTSRIITTDWRNSCDVVFGGVRSGHFNLLLAKPSLIVKPAGAGPGAGIPEEVLYAVWAQFGPTDTDCATQDSAGTPGGSVNGDLWMSASSDDGLTWDAPANITGTQTPNCLPGDCHSEHWVSADDRADSGIYLSFVDDTHGGAEWSTELAHLEGTWSRANYKVFVPESRLPVGRAQIEAAPIDFAVLEAGPTTQTVQVIVSNTGSAELDFTAAVTDDDGGMAHVQVEGEGSYSSAIASAGAAETLDVAYDGIGLPDSSEWVWRVEITSNDPANNPAVGGVPIDVTLQVRVSAPCAVTLTGDVNANASITSADIIYLVNYVFKAGAPPLPCVATGDVNCSSTVTSADVIVLVGFVFKAGVPPCDACTLIPSVYTCP
jgi:hypothetical protein